MNLLHLIIHKEIIESELKACRPERRKKLEEVLARIHEIENNQTNVRHVDFDKSDPDNLDLDGIHYVIELCQGYSKVQLYGSSTEACLPFAKRRLESAGYLVAYDEKGVID